MEWASEYAIWNRVSSYVMFNDTLLRGRHIFGSKRERERKRYRSCARKYVWVLKLCAEICFLKPESESRKNIDDLMNLIWISITEIETLNVYFVLWCHLDWKLYFPNAAVVVVVFEPFFSSSASFFSHPSSLSWICYINSIAWERENNKQLIIMLRQSTCMKLCDFPFAFRFKSWLSFLQCCRRRPRLWVFSRKTYNRHSSSSPSHRSVICCLLTRLTTVDSAIKISIVDYWLK